MVDYIILNAIIHMYEWLYMYMTLETGDIM